MKYRLVCPRCDVEFSFAANPPKSTYRVVCPDCRKDFEVLIAKIRAKRSRGDRRSNCREFDVRVIKLSGREELLQFDNAAYEDFELRQGDEAAFYYVNNTLRLVHNLSIAEVYVIRRRSCYLATYVYGSESDEVILLRRFRDEVLMPRAGLAGLVHLYYRASPGMIRLFGDAHLCKVVVAGAIAPVLWLARRWAAARAEPDAAPGPPAPR